MSRVVLTGASRGIGRATALQLAKRGADLLLPGRLSDALRETARAAREIGADVEELECDLAKPGQIETAARRVLACGAPSVLINNAAVIERHSVEAMSLADWQRQLDVNITAVFLWVKALLPAMRAQRTGRIINVGSIASTVGTARASAYCASKWALVGFTKSLAEELADSGLMTVAVLPGSVDTDMLRGSGFEPRMTAGQVAATLAHYALDAPVCHNGGVVEMFGV